MPQRVTVYLWVQGVKSEKNEENGSYAVGTPSMSSVATPLTLFQQPFTVVYEAIQC